MKIPWSFPPTPYCHHHLLLSSEGGWVSHQELLCRLSWDASLTPSRKAFGIAIRINIETKMPCLFDNQAARASLHTCFARPAKRHVPLSASQCPACGTATPVDADETQIDVEENFAENDDLTLATSSQGAGRSLSQPPSSYRSSRWSPAPSLGGRYEILKMLGEGGMGSVFKAHDEEVDRIVALKVIRPELAGSMEILQRFRQELVLAQQITHRNAVRIYDLASC